MYILIYFCFEIFIMLLIVSCLFSPIDFVSSMWAPCYLEWSRSCPPQYPYYQVQQNHPGHFKEEFQRRNLKQGTDYTGSAQRWEAECYYHEGLKDTGEGWCHQNQRLRLSHGWDWQGPWREGLADGELEPLWENDAQNRVRWSTKRIWLLLTSLSPVSC